MLQVCLPPQPTPSHRQIYALKYFRSCPWGPAEGLVCRDPVAGPPLAWAEISLLLCKHAAWQFTDANKSVKDLVTQLCQLLVSGEQRTENSPFRQYQSSTCDYLTGEILKACKQCLLTVLRRIYGDFSLLKEWVMSDGWFLSNYLNVRYHIFQPIF